MRKAGKTRREIAEYFDLEKAQIKNWRNRYHREQTRLDASLPPKRREQPCKTAPTNIEEYQHEINRLKMENELLRDFLR